MEKRTIKNRNTKPVPSLPAPEIPTIYEIENAVIGAMLVDSKAYGIVCEIVDSDCFYLPKNKTVYDAIVSIAQDKGKIDLLTVVAKLHAQGQLEMVGGAYEITEYTNNVCSTANVEFHARQLQEYAIRRKVQSLSHSLTYRAGNMAEDSLDLMEELKAQAEQIHEKATGKNAARLLREMEGLKFNPNAHRTKLDSILSVNLNGENYPIAGFGNLVVIAGGQKSRKSTASLAMVASAITGEDFINFNLDARGRDVVIFDTEQPRHRFEKTQDRLMSMAMIQDLPENYAAYCLRGFTIQERLAAIDRYIMTAENLGVVVLDGIVDLIEDYNDLKTSRNLVDKIMQWSDKKNILLICVLHLTKTTAQLRGHLGTELQNKADAVIETEKADDHYTTVKCRESREIPFPDFQFTQDKWGIPVLELPIEDSAHWAKVEKMAHTHYPDMPF